MKNTALGYPSEEEIEALLNEERKKEALRSTTTMCTIGDCLNCIAKDLERIEQASKE